MMMNSHFENKNVHECEYPQSHWYDIYAQRLKHLDSLGITFSGLKEFVENLEQNDYGNIKLVSFYFNQIQVLWFSTVENHDTIGLVLIPPKSQK